MWSSLQSLWLSLSSTSSSILKLLPFCASLVSCRYWKNRCVSPLSSSCQPPDAAPRNIPPPEPRSCFLFCHSPRRICWIRNFLLGPTISSVPHKLYLSSDSCSVGSSPLKLLIVSDECNRQQMANNQHIAITIIWLWQLKKLQYRNKEMQLFQ